MSDTDSDSVVKLHVHDEVQVCGTLVRVGLIG